MNLNTQKNLLNLATAGCLLVGFCVLAFSLTAETPVNKAGIVDLGELALAKTAAESIGRRTTINPSEDHWNRKWRRPLYNPPPVKKQLVVVPPRPVTFVLTGTVIEAANPMAFIRLSNGQIVLRQVGEQVTMDPSDGKVSEITARGIVVSRETEEIQLAVQKSN